MKPRKMKDSGIPWIGQIPEGWTVRKLRFLGSLDSNGVDKKTREDEPLFKAVHYMDVYKNSLGEIGNSEDYLVISAPAEKGAACALFQGDVIFTNSSETPDDIGHSAVVKQDLDNTLFGYHLTRFRPFGKMALRFEKYLFGNQYLKSWFASRATGITRYSITYQDFAEALPPVPSVPEQERIATYLDGKCGEIDRVIAAKERQNELLQAQRAALISETVTKGLNPKAKFKDSGIEWIGKMPSTWSARRIKMAAKLLRGKFSYRPRNEPSLYDGPYPFIQTGDVANANGYIRQYTQTLNEHGLSVSTLFPKNTLIMTIAANIGDVAILDFDACFPDSIIGFVPSLDILGMKYLFYAFKAMKGELLSLAPVNTQGNLNIERVGNMPLPLPSLPEQEQIAAYLDVRCGEIDRVMAANEGMVAKLKEYRSSLIWEAVTGKICV